MNCLLAWGKIKKQGKRSVPNVEEFRNIAHLEIKVNSVKEGAVGVNVEPIDPGVRQPRSGRLRNRRFTCCGTQARRRLGPPGNPRRRPVDVLLPGDRRTSLVRREGDETHGSQDRLELVVRHEGFERSGIPKR